MQSHKHVIAVGVLLTTTALASSAFAVGAPFSDIDTNRDGALSKQELADAFGATGARSALRTLDTNKDGAISIDEAAAADDEQSDESDIDVADIDFEDVDTDGDGKLSMAELTAAFGAEDAKEIMAELQGEPDGSVSLDDFHNAIAEVLAGAVAVAIEDGGFIDLDAADADGDGKLTKKELTDAFGESEAKELLEHLDLNGDGTITDAEFGQVADGDTVPEEGNEEIDLYSIDLNADGKITREELEAVLGDSADDALNDFDEDKDGAISTDELERLYDDGSDGDIETDVEDDEAVDDEDEDDDTE